MISAQVNFDAVSVSDAADIIGCTVGRVRQLLQAGELRGRKLGTNDRGPWLVSKVSAEKVARKPSRTGRPRKHPKQF